MGEGGGGGGGGGEILHSHGTNRKKGVCILINPQFNDFQTEYSCSDAEGRIILANISVNSFQIPLCNIYAPNNLQMRNAFVKDLNQFLLSNVNVSRLIVGGDWNVALGAIDKRHTTFKLIKSISKQNKLKEFIFKLAHRIVITKKELHLYGIEDNKSCHYCGDDDSLRHSFLGCQIAVDFFRKVLCWFNEKENSSITLNSEEIPFGAAADNDNKIKKN